MEFGFGQISTFWLFNERTDGEFGKLRAFFVSLNMHFEAIFRLETIFYFKMENLWNKICACIPTSFDTPMQLFMQGAGLF